MTTKRHPEAVTRTISSLSRTNKPVKLVVPLWFLSAHLFSYQLRGIHTGLLLSGPMGWSLISEESSGRCPNPSLFNVLLPFLTPFDPQES